MFNLLGQPMKIYFKKGQNGEPDQFCIQAHGRLFYRDKIAVHTFCFFVMGNPNKHPRGWIETRGFLEGDRILPYPTFGLGLFTRLTRLLGWIFQGGTILRNA